MTVNFTLSPEECADLKDWMTEKGLTEDQVCELARQRLLEELVR